MGNYTVNMFNQAAWLVYINGLEIPVSSLTVQYGVWEAPTLNLSMVPHTILTQLGSEDRLQVAVFYLDHHWDPGNPQFCLLGEFEVVGWSYNNTPRGRFVNLNCVSHLQIFEQLHFFYVSSMNDIVDASSPITATDASGATVVKVLYPASLFHEGLTAPESVKVGGTSADVSVDSDPFIKRPIDFVLNIFRSLLRPYVESSSDDFGVPAGSVAIPKTAASVPGKNFFARWLKMTGFHKRWAALPYLEDEGEVGCFPLLKATQDTVTLPALQKQLGQSVGNAGSAWELLQQVLGHMYMEICVVPAPPAARTLKKVGTIIARGTMTPDTTLGSINSIPTFFVKPMCTFALPPACNVVFPSMIRSYTFQENYMRQPTRLYLSEQFISDVIAPPTGAGSQTNFVQNLLVTGYPAALRKRMKDLLKSSPATSNKNFLLFEEEFFKGPVTKRANAPPWMYLLQQMENANVGPDSATDKEIDALVGDAIEEGMSASPLGALFDTYAKYEYYRSRYAERSGGVGMLWNPYIVPGFPIAVFDQRSAGFDTMGYANTVTHSMNASGDMSTMVNMTFVRTMPEFAGLTTEDSSLVTDERLDISPPEVIPEVRDVFQHTVKAHELYSRMLYREAPMKKSAVFDWKAMLEVTNAQGSVIDATENAWLLDSNITLNPKGEYKGLFEGYDAAMQYASRPACTLTEYIETWHGRTLNSLLRDDTVRGEYTSFYSPTNDAKQERGAVFWGRIYTLKQGPGSNPGLSVTNMGGAPDYASAGASGWGTVDASTGMAQTRQDWDTKLEEYRKIVRSEQGRIAPQD